MLRRFLLPVALLAAVVGGALPSHAASYTKTYYGGSGGLLITTTNPARDYGNPADQGNVADDLQVGVGLLTETDPVFNVLQGTPADTNLLRGTPVDKNFLNGTPADNEVAGVQFASFAGKPTKLKITDVAGGAVPWIAEQCLHAGFCGQPGDPEAKGCGTPGAGTTLNGFLAGHPVTVFIFANNSVDAAAWGTGDCDGPGTTGTVTLTTI